MKKSFEIKINDIRKIMLKLLLKRPSITLLIIFIIGCLLFSIYCILIGFYFDEEALQMAYSALGLFVISFITTIACIYIIIFKKIKGNGNDIITFEYEFNNENVLIKNISKNKQFILNKQYIKKYYIILDVLVVFENFTFLFPNDEEIKKNLNIYIS